MNSSTSYRDPTPAPEKIHSITPARYAKLSAQAPVCQPDNSTVKRLIIILLKDRPRMWKNQTKKYNKKEWETLATDIYEKSGHFADVGLLRKMWGNVKTTLLRKIRTTVAQKMDHQAKMRHLHGWEFFAEMEWYYSTLEKYEAKLRGEADESDDDDILYIGTFQEEDTANEHNEQVVMRMPTIKSEHTDLFTQPQVPEEHLPGEQHRRDESASQHSWNHENQGNFQDMTHRQMPVNQMQHRPNEMASQVPWNQGIQGNYRDMAYRQFPINQVEMPMMPMFHERESYRPPSRRYSNDTSSVFTAEHTRKRPASDYYETVTSFYKAEVNRIFTTYPDKEDNIRKVMCKTLAALDEDPETSLEDHFFELANHLKRVREEKERKEREQRDKDGQMP